MQERLNDVQNRIAAACARSGRDASEIRLIWVSKNHSQQEILGAHVLGAHYFGENRVQEVLEKFPLPPNPETGFPLDYELHLIGHLQSNKVRKVLPLCSAIHSIDSVDLWETTARIASELNLKCDVFLQVNTSRELQKSGFPVNGLSYTIENLMASTHLRLVGLMTMGPTEGDANATRSGFRELRGLLQNLRQQSSIQARFPELQFLSMGMSGDFEIAVEEGAHYLRIGTALFGERI